MKGIGSLMCFAARRMPIVMGLGAGMAVVQGMFFHLGNRYDTFRKEHDEFARKETIRRTTRVPIEQTVAELGEGRGKSRTTSIRSRHPRLTRAQQVSDPPATKRGESSGSRRSTVWKSAPSQLLSRVANKSVVVRRNGAEAIVHNSSRRGRHATLEKLEFCFVPT